MRFYPGSYGTNNQRVRLVRNRQLPYQDRAITNIPVSLGDIGPTAARFGLPAALGAVISLLAGYSVAKGALLGAAVGAVFPDFGTGLSDEGNRLVGGAAASVASDYVAGSITENI